MMNRLRGALKKAIYEAKLGYQFHADSYSYSVLGAAHAAMNVLDKQEQADLQEYYITIGKIHSHEIDPAINPDL